MGAYKSPFRSRHPIFPSRSIAPRHTRNQFDFSVRLSIGRFAHLILYFPQSSTSSQNNQAFSHFSSLTNNLHTSTSKIAAIWYNTSSGGCISFVHQRDTVDRSRPICSANQREDLSFSARTALMRLNFFFMVSCCSRL